MTKVNAFKLTKTALAVVTAVAAASFSASASAEGSREPLLMEGKTTLYQRVLTTPSCKLHAKADASDAGKEIAPLSQYYVYSDTGATVEVGADTTGKIAGFLDKSCTVPWKMQLALHFTNSANRNRALIFEQEAGLDNIIDSDDGAQQYKKLYETASKGGQAEGVISIEPDKYVDPSKNFYLLPILNSVESIYPDGNFVYKHEIASVTAKDSKSSTDTAAKAKGGDASAKAASAQATTKANESAAKNGSNSDDPYVVAFKSAIVFVIDSSISMRPYIERTKQAINSIYKSIESNNLNDSVHFGIVSFRADTKSTPGLEYTTKMYLKPGEAVDAKTFNEKVATLDQAKVSSTQFDEDAYAGINMALQDINWNNYGGRYIVLITDAGAIDAGDKQSSTGMDANSLRLEAQHYGAAVYTMHLLTNSGAKNHKKAKDQYEILSFNQILNKPLYYPVNAGDVKAFGSMVDTLSSSLTAQVKRAVMGQMSAGSSLAASDKLKAEADKNKDANDIAKKPTNDQEKALVNDSDKLGLAMQLAYLGRVTGAKSPDFLQGWMYDRDVENHNTAVCTPVVLVNRNQLSDLYTLVNGVLESGIAGQLSSDDMFSQLKALAAQMGRDPNQLSKSKSIGEMGIMGELLDDLPYKSMIANLSPEDWYNLGSQEQERIVRALENSLNYIQHCSGDNDRFIKLNVDADTSDEVYPIPLDALP
ncbi:MAG: vWA domain-containing protein [Anaerobiospirillum succiniciproducens]|uniref:vWA domain-containing protein n=1 Tax=Anaerobiospirillum succiniciproducens TaxID=13335 RepID=UPI00235373B9|nr:vWA domain-containing protein [Anaerobiospirillum succiniciproducens]MCI6862900.1 VWA domain-containing protein [Anaerobiospirillum succiniciproducens]MDY2798341.1 vWA domain-containing protein [Anaerobiospirillum succiniciproducens]